MSKSNSLDDNLGLAQAFQVAVNSVNGDACCRQVRTAVLTLLGAWYAQPSQDLNSNIKLHDNVNSWPRNQSISLTVLTARAQALSGACC